jgi:hypothetical protein
MHPPERLGALLTTEAIDEMLAEAEVLFGGIAVQTREEKITHAKRLLDNVVQELAGLDRATRKQAATRLQELLQEQLQIPFYCLTDENSE